MTSEPRERPPAAVGIDFRDWRPGGLARRRPPVAVGLCVIASVALIGLSVGAASIIVNTAGASLFSHSVESSSAGDQRALQTQSKLVDQRRAAVADYATKLSEFKRVTARPDGAVGINLDAAEATRRDAVLVELVLECIDAIGGYNLSALARTPAQLVGAGLPERFVWAVDCAAG